MVLRKMPKTECDYHLRFLSYSNKCVGVPRDPGAKKIIFSSLKKIQKIFRMVLTIDSPLFLDIDQNCQKNQSSKINGFRVASAQIYANFDIQFLRLYLSNFSHIYIKIYVFEHAESIWVVKKHIKLKIKILIFFAI